jgi:hypothetical protein
MFETFADRLIFDLIGLSPETLAGTALHFFVMDTAKFLVLLVGVFYAMGLVRALFAGLLALSFTLVGWGFNALARLGPAVAGWIDRMRLRGYDRSHTVSSIRRKAYE